MTSRHVEFAGILVHRIDGTLYVCFLSRWLVVFLVRHAVGMLESLYACKWNMFTSCR